MAKYNLYRILPTKKSRLIRKLESVGLEKVGTNEVDGLKLEFFFSSQPDEVDIWWTQVYGNFFGEDQEVPTNKIYFATMIASNNEVCYAVSLGKSHFYLKKFCDRDFGLNLAERIVDEHKLKVKNSKFFKSKRNKTITSYHGGSEMDYGSGESMHYLKAATINEEVWGKTASFGNSVQINLDMEPEDLPVLIELIEQELKKPSRFQLPKTEVVVDDAAQNLLDRKLARELLKQSEDSGIQVDEFSVSGVDFIFADRDTYSFYLKGNSSGKTEPMELSVKNLLQFVKTRGIDLHRQIDNIMVYVHNEHGRGHSQQVKYFLDFVDNEDRYCLIDGKWHRFNQAYLDFLKKEVNKINPEYDFAFDIPKGKIEEVFNEDRAREDGFINYDKSLTTMDSRFKVEYFDLYKDETLFFVKFGTAQKLGYVIDQAINTIKLLQNKAGEIEIEGHKKEVKTICLWLGLTRKTKIKKLSEINSLIFQMKLAEWRRLVVEAGFVSKVKINYRLEKELTGIG